MGEADKPPSASATRANSELAGSIRRAKVTSLTASSSADS
jgi:hypothetical protein